MSSWLRTLVSELHTRRVFRTIGAYGILCWVVLQLLDVLGEAIGVTARGVLVIASIMATGFPIVTLLSWYFDLTPSGLLAAEPRAGDESSAPRAQRYAGPLLAVALSGAVAVGAISWHLQSPSDATARDTDLAVLRDDSARLKLAVLNLRDISQRQDLAWLAEGLSDELRQRLGSIDRFEVIPGAFLRNETINSLDPDTRLAIDGSIRGTDSDIHVKLTVIDLQQERTLWTQDFQGKNNDPLELQQQITIAMARVFDASLGTSNRGPTQPDAYALYLNFVYEQYGEPEADALALERILELDPSWANGWQSLVEARQRLWTLNRDKENSLVLARGAAAKADIRHGDNASSFALEAFFKAYLEGDLDGAEQDFRTMVTEWGSGFPYAILMCHSGLHAEAAEFFEKLMESYPYHPGAIGAWDWIAVARMNLNDFHGALDATRHHGRLISANNPFPQSGLPKLLPVTGHLDDARELLQRTLQNFEEYRTGSATKQFSRRIANSVAFEIAMAEGNTEKALALAAEIAPDHPVDAGIRYLILGDHRAERMLSQAGEQPSHLRAQWAYVDALLPSELREHPFILNLEGALGFDKAWRLELCKRAAQLPPESLISCDPDKYAL